MYKNFDKLNDDKKNKIIQAAIREFADKGYMAASTNNIVKEADISKGALFNYFDNKKNLYLYVTDYAIEYYLNYMMDKIKINNPDIFQRILEWQELKISISTENPIVYKFFASVFINTPEELKSDIDERYKRLKEYSEKLTLKDIDLSLFRDDIDKQKALEIIAMALNGILENSNLLYKSLDDYGYDNRNQFYTKLKEYVVVLRKVFYKEEYN
ncbi:TetR/AcrR family transcriptional regulator [Clostridium paridis]|uniref:TetR/AcrR family transcriptional regulator n=1 Tax=Clostridium paridis TaxID=2803863 RepID=A0A937K2D6_9CLOT|nr:TetR/AcrR family transcriptional regulator [Clostridium paridis]MBL4930552.1 TetR/AcrR family transcriptional regulator [Clostridium paridis]